MIAHSEKLRCKWVCYLPEYVIDPHASLLLAWVDESLFFMQLSTLLNYYKTMLKEVRQYIPSEQRCSGRRQL